MATTTTANAAAGFPLTTPNDGVVAVAYGSVAVSTNPDPADTIEFCRLPEGAVVVGGFLQSSALDTDGSPSLAYKLGTESDDDAFLAAIAYGSSARENRELFNDVDNSMTALSASTKVVLTWTASAATFAAGNASLVVYYVMPVNG